MATENYSEFTEAESLDEINYIVGYKTAVDRGERRIAKDKVVYPEIPVLTSYPTTDSTKAGQEFWYKGRKWHYMTSDLITDIGWDVAEGFPAPVDLIDDDYLKLLDVPLAGYPNDTIDYPTTRYDILGYGRPDRKINGIVISWATITEIKNAKLLTALEDVGTTATARLYGCADTVIDSFFTQLPTTTKTATLDVSNSPGAGTCTPSIATNKGYTVVT